MADAADERKHLGETASRLSDFLYDTIGGPERSQHTLAGKTAASLASFLSCLADDLTVSEADLGTVLADTIRGLVRCVEHDIETRPPIEVEAYAALLRATRLFEAHGPTVTSGNARRTLEGAKALLPAGFRDTFKVK